MVADYLEGESVRAVAKGLNDAGSRRPRGGSGPQPPSCTCSAPPVSTAAAGLPGTARILRSVARPTEMTGCPWSSREGVLDPATWLRLQEVLDSNSYRRGPQNLTLLSGLARCGRCGGRLSGQKTKGHPIYRCSVAIRGEGCQGTSVSMENLDRWVLGRVCGEHRPSGSGDDGLEPPGVDRSPLGPLRRGPGRQGPPGHRARHSGRFPRPGG